MANFAHPPASLADVTASLTLALLHPRKPIQNWVEAHGQSPLHIQGSPRPTETPQTTPQVLCSSPWPETQLCQDAIPRCGLRELAVERRYHGHTPPGPNCPHNTPHGARARVADRFHPRSHRSTTRRVHQPHASYTRINTTADDKGCLPSTRTRAVHATDPKKPSHAPRVCFASRLYQHRRTWITARRTRCSS